LPRDSYLKGIRPRYDKDGLRIFFCQNRTSLFRLEANRYTLVENRSPYAFTKVASLGFAVFSSGASSFAYEFNTTTIYSYCESLIVGGCPLSIKLPCSLRLPYCALCDSASLVCTQCLNSFRLENNKCIKTTTNCSGAHCTLCYINNTCLECDHLSIINLISKQCDLIENNTI
jgi:hypothetical protein